LQLVLHPSLEEFLTQTAGKRLWLLTTKGTRFYTEVSYEPDDYLLFGKETAGLPGWLLARYPDHCLRIPMGPKIRSLNLSNTVAIVLYEALRQQGFPGLV
jgi:tRNA (cytidine/uridine-2'-O-)-methyltransferase